MRNSVLCLTTMIFALAGVLTPSTASRADDYDVAFGVETKLGQDFGSVTCSFNEVCSARMDSLGLRVTILVFQNDPGAPPSTYTVETLAAAISLVPRIR